MKKYRAAIIGCGNIASLFDKKLNSQIAFSHAGAYRMHPKTDLIAACDIDPQKVNAFGKKWKITGLYTDYAKMLRKEKIDLLSICTPPKTHPSIVLAAARSSVKAIYCEKPIALDVAAAKKITKICRERKKLFTINHQRRFSPFWQEVREKISRGLLGDIQQVNCFYTRGIYNTGTHILDLFAFLFGSASWVIAAPSTNQSPIPQDPNVDGMIFFKKGFLATLKACNDSDYLILEIDILGSKGRLKIGRQVEYLKATASKNLLGKNELVPMKDLPFKAAYGLISLTSGVQHIIDCLEKRKEPISSGSQAIESLKIIRAMITSSRKKKQIYIT